MKGSIIIPTLNCSKTLGSCLKSIKRNVSDKEYEIIVVDDGSQDGTVEIAKRFGVKLVKRKYRKGPGPARNEGVKISRGKILYFIDSDCVAFSGWPSEINREFTNPEVAAVCGSILNGTKSIFAKAIHFCWASSIHPKTKRAERMLLTSANMAIRKSVFEEVGGFDEKMEMAEDSDLSVRIYKKGYKMIYQPKATVLHIHRRMSFSCFIKHRFKHGFWEAINLLKYKPLQPYSRFFSRNWILTVFFLPAIVVASVLLIIKRNIRISKSVFAYIPLLLIGRIAWGIGALKGIHNYRKVVECLDK